MEELKWYWHVIWVEEDDDDDDDDGAKRNV
jgi:hypothetical protein